MVIEYEDNILEIVGTSTEVRHPIKDVVEIGDAIFVVLDPPSDGQDPRNVLAFDTSGNRLWEIEAVQSRHSDTEIPYTSVVEKDGRIVAYNWNSYRYGVDPETGAVTELGFYK